MSSPLSAIRLVIYDLDGTLLDAFDDIHACMNRALAACGLPPLMYAQVKSAVGDGALVLVRRCLGEGRMDRFDELYARFMEFYSANPEPAVHLYPGVLEALARVRTTGLAQAVLTNKPQVVTDRCCADLGITPLVDGIWGARPGEPLKPDPESLLRIARHFSVPPAACAMVGDYRADYDVARAAGARMIGVTWGLFDLEQTKAENPDAVIDEMDELPGILPIPIN